MRHRILSLESSCDDTAIALIDLESSGDQIKKASILFHYTQSQVQVHRPYGGVIPEAAARAHLHALSSLWSKINNTHRDLLSSISWLAVTMGPGLIGPLLTGTYFMKGLATQLKCPIRGIDHIRAHLAPAFFPVTPEHPWTGEPPLFPSLGLTVSGGHTRLSYLRSETEHEILGTSIDDACGECLDKVGKVIGLSYPAGALIEKLAEKAPHLFEFQFPKHIQTPEPFQFSFSGLKTAAIRSLCHLEGIEYGAQQRYDFKDISNDKKSDLAYYLQKACFSQIVSRLSRALKAYPDVRAIYVAGGVAANLQLRQDLSQLSRPIYCAPVSLCTDNAVMIGLQSFFEGQNLWKAPCYIGS